MLFTSPGAQDDDYLPEANFARQLLGLFDANGDDKVDRQEFTDTLSSHHLLCGPTPLAPCAATRLTCCSCLQVRLFCSSYDSWYGANEATISHARLCYE